MESHLRLPVEIENNIEHSSRPLVVNCCGRLVLSRSFYTHSPNGRNDYYLLYLWQGELLLHSEAVRQGPADPSRKAEGLTNIPQPIRLSAGEMLLIPPHVEYIYEHAEGSEIIYYWVHFSGYLVEELLQQAALQPTTPRTRAGRPAGVYSPGIHENVTDLFEKLFHEFLYRDKHFEAAAATILADILLTLARYMDQPAGIKRKQIQKIAKSLQFIRNNLANNTTVEALAQLEHLSVSRYRSVFRECMGASPTEYIISLRLNRACELMSDFAMPVTEASRHVGYQDPLYFSRLFRRKMGMSPREYRQSRLY